MSGPAALLQALRLARQPELRDALRASPLPEGMLALIRIAGDDGHGSALERRAASVFLQEVCLFEKADFRRRLGLTLADDHLAARKHHRLLMKWLHPDRNSAHQLLAGRVNSAWTEFKQAPPQFAAANAVDEAIPAGKLAARSRFPFFLLLLILGSVLLLAMSFLPEAPVYSSRLSALGPSASNLARSRPINRATPGLSEQGAVSKEAGTASFQVDSPPAPSLAQAEEALQQFRIRYRQGDLQGFMRLFSPTVISLRGGYETIAAVYGRLFRTTRRRDIAFINPEWHVTQETRRLRAGFLTESVKFNRATPVSQLGTIEILFVQERGETRIVELLVTE